MANKNDEKQAEEFLSYNNIRRSFAGGGGVEYTLIPVSLLINHQKILLWHGRALHWAYPVSNPDLYTGLNRPITYVQFRLFHSLTHVI